MQPAIQNSTLNGEIRNLTAASNNHAATLKSVMSAGDASATRKWWLGLCGKVWDVFASFGTNLGAARKSAFLDNVSKK